MKTLHRFLLATIFSVGAIATAHADCYKDGKAYPTGTVIDGFVCKADGQWKK